MDILFARIQVDLRYNSPLRQSGTFLQALHSPNSDVAGWSSTNYNTIHSFFACKYINV